MYRLLLLLLFCLTIVSCKKDKTKYYYVAEDAVLSYQQNDQLVYKNEVNQYDTFIVSEVSHDMWPTGEADNTYRENYYFTFQRKSNLTSFGDYTVALGPTYFLGIIWNNRYFESQNNNYDIDKFMLYDSVYENVKRILCEENRVVIDTIYYQYKYGVLQYYDNEGHTWKLFSKPND